MEQPEKFGVVVVDQTKDFVMVKSPTAMTTGDVMHFAQQLTDDGYQVLGIGPGGVICRPPAAE